MEKYLPAGMKSARKSHPWKRFFVRRDEISITEGPAFSKLPSGEILNPTTFRIDPLFYDLILRILKKFAVLFRYDLQMHRKSDKGEEVSRNECRRKAVTVDG